MREPIFAINETVAYTVDGLKYQVEDITNTAGTPQERFYTFRLLGRYSFGWIYTPPAITHTFSESYVREHFVTQNTKITMANTAAKKAKLFNTSSPGFLYSVIVFVLGVFASTGVTFPKDVSTLGIEIITTLSTGGVWALAGVFVASILYPIFNWYKSGGKFDLAFVFGKRSNVLALMNAVFAGIALTGFILPEGTVEALFQAIVVQDWGALAALVFGPVLDTLIRFIKERKNTGELAG